MLLTTKRTKIAHWIKKNLSVPHLHVVTLRSLYALVQED